MTLLERVHQKHDQLERQRAADIERLSTEVAGIFDGLQSDLEEVLQMIFGSDSFEGEELSPCFCFDGYYHGRDKAIGTPESLIRRIANALRHKDHNTVDLSVSFFNLPAQNGKHLDFSVRQRLPDEQVLQLKITLSHSWHSRYIEWNGEIDSEALEQMVYEVLYG